MIKRFPIISADIFYKNVGTEEKRKDLIQQAWDEFHKNEKTIAWTNKGCWRSTFKYKSLDWLMEEIRIIVNEAGKYYQETDPIYTKKSAMFTGSEIKYWTNINRPLSKNAIHEHKLYHYVAVYYLQAENTGDLTFYNPINLTEACNPTAPFVSTISISPKDGDLLVWPAWVPHEVEMNMSDKHRINIAMNIRFNSPMPYDDENY
ncbi:MAG: hypothetical protein EBU90_12780 [Proteobacteria bacterium]|nr:hypothetical protein [Pseudomonadota bacterium]NBP14872.1 hypothetical protein [bacterium]